MITKERLLSGLHEATYVEEGMMTFFANFTKALTTHAEGIEGEKKKEIDKMLSLLNRDSARHKKMVEELIEKIERSEKNEY